jgi:hypothetical protein
MARADSAESMFAQELARRGLAENGSVEGGPSAMERLKRAAGKAMPPAFAPDATPSATPRQDEIDNQLEKSRKLNAEGLEVRSVIERRHRMGEPMHVASRLVKRPTSNQNLQLRRQPDCTCGTPPGTAV